jgi:hypothetical protein
MKRVKFLSGRRRTLLVAMAAVVAVGGWWVVAVGREWLSRGDSVVVRRGDLVLSLPVGGTLKAVNSEQIGSPQAANYWGGFKISFLAPEGAEVAAGQPVLGFDISELQRELEKKRAEADQARQEAEKRRAEVALATEDARLRLAEAEAALRRADLKLTIPAELEAGNVVKTAELDREQVLREVSYLKEKAASDQRAAEAEIGKLQEMERRAAARVVEIEHAIVHLTVTAPRAGTVIYVTNWRGEKRKVGDTVWRRDPVLEIPDLSSMMAVGQVDEADAGRVSVGQRVALRLDAHPDVEFTGTLTAIAPAIERKSWESREKVVSVEIGLDATDRMRMRPGMRFVGKVEVRRIADAVLVPVDAVSATPDGPVAVRRTPFGLRETRLRLGERNEELVQVLDGLEPNDRVERKGASREEGK